MLKSQGGMTSESKQTYKCKYCSRSFARETTLAVHVCEQKKRYQHKDSPSSRMAFQSYIKFYEIAQGSAKQKTFDDFATSAYYKAFVKFANYCANARVINTVRFTEWLLKHNKRIDYWGSDKLYDEFLKEYIFRENATDALTRALETSVTWSEENQAPSQDFLRHGNTNKLCQYIASGKITGWTIFNCDTGHELLENLNQEQIAMVYDFINPDRWSKILRDYPGDTEYMKEMLGKAGW